MPRPIREIFPAPCIGLMWTRQRLVNALQDLVDREIWRTPCRLEVKPSFRIEDDAAAAHLYRIAREAVINANKHAQAREIIVKLQRSRREMVLHVIDDGIGFPKDLKPQQGLGYHIMKYRAQLMGGRLEIDSPQTGGTRVSCYLPSRVSPSRNAKNGEQTAGAMPKQFKPASRQRSNFATSGAAGSRECVEEIKRFLILVLDYVATDPAPETDERRALHK